MASAKALKKERMALTIRRLEREYPDAHCALRFANAFELLIATILSAQCTDERVNIVTLPLFKKYPTPQKMAKAPLKDLESLIHSTGFYKNKAKNILLCCQTLIELYGGEVPQTIEELHALAGVGRKTANVVLGNAFGIASGVVVDTHVTRLANRLGWVRGDNAVIIERKLNELVDQRDWIMLPHWLISHGRKVCKARSPDCDHCFLQEACPKKGLKQH